MGRNRSFSLFLPQVGLSHCSSLKLRISNCYPRDVNFEGKHRHKIVFPYVNHLEVKWIDKNMDRQLFCIPLHTMFPAAKTLKMRLAGPREDWPHLKALPQNLTSLQAGHFGGFGLHALVDLVADLKYLTRLHLRYVYFLDNLDCIEVLSRLSNTIVELLLFTTDSMYTAVKVVSCLLSPGRDWLPRLQRLMCGDGSIPDYYRHDITLATLFRKHLPRKDMSGLDVLERECEARGINTYGIVQEEIKSEAFFP